jgi:hypothetical protein
MQNGAVSSTVAEFIDSDWGDKINSGIELSYRPARLHGLVDRCDNPMLKLTLSPRHGSMNSATEQRTVQSTKLP